MVYRQAEDAGVTRGTGVMDPVACGSPLKEMPAPPEELQRIGEDHPPDHGVGVSAAAHFQNEP